MRGRHGVFIATQAVDNQRFRTPIDPQRVAALRSRLELGDCPTVTFVGRLVPWKGVADSLAASALVDHPIGWRSPAGSMELIRDQAESLGIADRVRFIGHVAEPDLLELLHASSLPALPSRTSRRWREPWGMVTNEVISSAVPVISTDAVGAAAGGLVVQGETGLVIPQRDPRALAAGIRELIEDESKRRLLGQTAQARVRVDLRLPAADACEEAVASAVRLSGREGLQRERRLRQSPSDRSRLHSADSLLSARQPWHSPAGHGLGHSPLKYTARWKPAPSKKQRERTTDCHGQFAVDTFMPTSASRTTYAHQAEDANTTIAVRRCTMWLVATKPESRAFRRTNVIIASP